MLEAINLGVHVIWKLAPLPQGVADVRRSRGRGRVYLERGVEADAGHFAARHSAGLELHAQLVVSRLLAREQCVDNRTFEGREFHRHHPMCNTFSLGRRRLLFSHEAVA